MRNTNEAFHAVADADAGPAKGRIPLTLPRLRPRSVRTQPPPFALPPRTYPRVDLPAKDDIEDTTMLESTLSPLPPRRAQVLAGVALLVIACVVRLASLPVSSAAARAAPAPAVAAGTLVAVDAPAGPAPPAPPSAAASAPLPSPRHALPAGARKAMRLAKPPPVVAPPVAEPALALEKTSSHRLFGVED